MSKIEISATERLILTMLSEIYKAQNIKGEIDPQFVLEAIFNGHSWALKEAYPAIFETSEPNDDDVTEVANILDMWWTLEQHYEQLSDDDKSEIDAAIAPFAVRLQGFDNHEGSTLSIARWFIDKLDRFADFKGRLHDTHSPVIDGYRRMLDVYRPIWQAIAQRSSGMTKDELIAVMKARRHPDWRG